MNLVIWDQKYSNAGPYHEYRYVRKMASKAALFGESSSGESEEEIDSSQEEEDQNRKLDLSDDDSDEQENVEQTEYKCVPMGVCVRACVCAHAIFNR